MSTVCLEGVDNLGIMTIDWGSVYTRTLREMKQNLLCLFMKKLPFTLFIYTNPTETCDENGNFRIW